MVHYSISCPHCGRTVEKGTDRYTQYRSPFRTCRFCGGTYFDKGCKEAGLMSKTDFKREAAPWSLLLSLVLGLLFLYANLDSQEPIGWIVGAIFTLIGVLPFITFLIYNPEKNFDLQREIEESKERLKDPNYVISLSRSGYKVPEETLAWAKKHVHDNTEEGDELNRLIKIIMANKNNQK